LANSRVIVKRRKSVRNIRKITRTMQLIATARFQAAFSRAVAARPYVERMTKLVADLSSAVEGEISHPLMKPREKATRNALLILTSNRGLCGGFNTNVLRTATEHLVQSPDTDVFMVGKKGVNYFRFLKREMAERVTNLPDLPRFSDVEPFANRFMDGFAKGQWASVHVCYMRFHSVAKQSPEVLRVLPLSAESAASDENEAVTNKNVLFEYSPDPKELLAELLPATVRIRLFQCFIDASVGEQVSRMVAMKAATDAASDMIKSLTRRYNRARQTQITMELLDIVSGANALA